MAINIVPNRQPAGDSFKLCLKGDASVQDYLDTLNRYYLEGKLTRLWPENNGICEGCHYCCHEPAPITLQDAYKLMEVLATDLTGLVDYLWIDEQHGAVDITLRRQGKDICTFLQKNGRCSIYNYRPLVCQTYICCPIDKDHEDLRSTIVNLGEDALIRQAIMEFKSHGKLLPVNRGSSHRVQLEDWPANKMSKARYYRQIYLKDVLPNNLYRKLQLI